MSPITTHRLRASNSVPLSVQWILIALLVVAGQPAVHAVELTVSPIIQEAAVGDIVTVDIVYDPQGTLVFTGGLNIFYARDVLELVDYQYGDVGDAGAYGTPQKRPGAIELLRFFEAAGRESTGVIATLSFRLISEDVGWLTILPIPNSWVAYPFELIQPVAGQGAVVASNVPFPLLRIPEEQQLDPIAVGETGFTEVTLVNDGTATLDVWSASLSPPFFFGVGFNIVEDNCLDQSVPPEGECRFVLSYTTNQLLQGREHSTQLRLTTSTVLDSTVFIPLTSHVASPRVRLQTQEFIEAPITPPFQQRRIRLVNDGEVATTLNNLELFGQDADAFTLLKDQCSGRSLGVGETCDLSMAFEPSEPGRYWANLGLTYDVFSELSPLLGLTPTGLAAIDIGGPDSVRLALGEFVDRRIIVTNKGPEPLTIFSSVLSGNFAVEVMGGSCLDRTLASGEACFIDLKLGTDNPLAAGVYFWAESLSTDSLYPGGSLLRLQVAIEAP
ncbi:MAG: choice-of-anchor D domain-containing protein [Gammaproteobacteria bacterium]